MTTAGELLKTWSFRLSMQDQGVTHPTESARALTRLLVEKLSQLHGDEFVEIDDKTNGEKVRFIRQATGETLVEIDLPPKLSSKTL